MTEKTARPRTSRANGSKNGHSNGHAQSEPSWSSVVGPAMQSLVAAMPRSAGPVFARLQSLRKDLPVMAMGMTGDFAAKLREIAGRDVIDLETLMDVLSVYYRLMAVRDERREGRWEIDEFGFDRAWSEAILPLARVIYRKYWRVTPAFYRLTAR